MPGGGPREVPIQLFNDRRFSVCYYMTQNSLHEKKENIKQSLTHTKLPGGGPCCAQEAREHATRDENQM